MNALPDTVTLTPRVNQWAERISTAWNKSREGFFEAGRLLIEAKDDCEHGEWTALVGSKQMRGELAFGARTAQMLMKIACDERLTKTKNFSLLPPSYAACYDLAKLDDEDFNKVIDAGIVRPDAKYTDVRAFLSQRSREKKHEAIREAAKTTAVEGRFPLIYADPPWSFDVYSERGKEISPERHYPTMTDDEIIALDVDGRTVPEIAHDDAVLFLWCTSANIKRAIRVLEGWGFTYKTHAVWVKDRTGTGYNFLNQHEPLLMGTRGKIPAPVWKPPSVFSYPRGRHSEKPPEIRTAIEKMYPHFDASTRLEMFCRTPSPSWTVFGYEAHSNTA